MVEPGWPQRQVARLFTSNDPLSDETYRSNDFCDVGFKRCDSYGAALLSTGRLTSDVDKGLDEDRDGALNRDIISQLARPGDAVLVWSWYAEGWFRPKREFEDIGDNREELLRRLSDDLSNPTGIKGFADFLLISSELMPTPRRRYIAKTLSNWEQTLRRLFFDGSSGVEPLIAAEAQVGTLAAEIGIVAHLSPEGMDSEAVVIYADERHGWIEETVTRYADKHGRQITPNPVLAWRSPASP